MGVGAEGSTGVVMDIGVALTPKKVKKPRCHYTHRHCHGVDVDSNGTEAVPPMDDEFGGCVDVKAKDVESAAGKVKRLLRKKKPDGLEKPMLKSRGRLESSLLEHLASSTEQWSSDVQRHFP